METIIQSSQMPERPSSCYSMALVRAYRVADDESKIVIDQLKRCVTLGLVTFQHATSVLVKLARCGLRVAQAAADLEAQTFSPFEKIQEWKTAFANLNSVVAAMQNAEFYGSIIMLVVDLANIVAVAQLPSSKFAVSSLTVTFVLRHAKFGGQQLINVISSYFAQSDPAPEDEAPHIAKTLWSMIKFYCGLAPHKTESDMTKSAQSLRTHLGLLCDFRRVLSVLHEVFQKVKSYFTREPLTVALATTAVSDLEASMLEFGQPVLEADMVADPTLAGRVDALNKKANSLSRQLLTLPEVPAALSSRMAALTLRVTNVYNTLPTLESNRVKRVRPVAIYFHGAPGTGKSELAALLATKLYQSEYRKSPRTKNEAMFARNVCSTHWDGYKSELTVLYDDPFQNQDQKLGSELGMELIQICQNSPYKLNMANLAGKMGTYMNSAYVIVTGNLPFLNVIQPLGFQDKQALLRRCSLSVVVHRNRSLPDVSPDAWTFTLHDPSDVKFDYEAAYKNPGPQKFEDLYKAVLACRQKYMTENSSFERMVESIPTIIMPEQFVTQGEPDDLTKVDIFDEIHLKDAPPPPKPTDLMTPVDLVNQEWHKLYSYLDDPKRSYAEVVIEPIEYKPIQPVVPAKDFANVKMPTIPPIMHLPEAQVIEMIINKNSAYVIFFAKKLAKEQFHKLYRVLCYLSVDEECTLSSNTLHHETMSKRLYTANLLLGRIRIALALSDIPGHRDQIFRGSIVRDVHSSFVQRIFTGQVLDPPQSFGVSGHRHVRLVTDTSDRVVSHSDFTLSMLVDREKIEPFASLHFLYLNIPNITTDVSRMPLRQEVTFEGLSLTVYHPMSQADLAKQFLADVSYNYGRIVLFFVQNLDAVDLALTARPHGNCKFLFMGFNKESTPMLSNYNYVNPIRDTKVRLKLVDLLCYDTNPSHAVAAFVANHFAMYVRAVPIVNCFSSEAKLYNYACFVLTTQLRNTQLTDRRLSYTNYCNFSYPVDGSNVSPACLQLYHANRSELVRNLAIIAGVLGFASAATYVAYLYFKKPEEETIETQGNYTVKTYTRDPKRPVITTPATFAPLTIQSWTPQGSYETLVDLVFNNEYFLTWMDEESRTITNIFALNIRSRLFVCPRHFITGFPDRKKTWLRVFDPIKKTVLAVTPVSNVSLWGCSQGDLMMIDIDDRHLPEGRDLHTHFIREAELKYITDGEVVMPTFQKNTFKPLAASGLGTLTGSESYVDNSSNHSFEVQQTIAFHYPTISGMCGCLYLMEVRGTWKIVATHIAGSAIRTAGLGMVVTHELISTFLNLTKVVPQSSVADTKTLFEETFNRPLLTTSTNPLVLPKGPKLIGYLAPKDAPSMVRKTSIVATDFIDRETLKSHIFPEYSDYRRPVRFNIFTNTEGLLLNPLQIALNKMTDKERDWSPLTRTIYSDFSRDYFERMPLGKTSNVLDPYFCLNARDVGLKNIQPTHSAGFTPEYYNQKASKLAHGKWFFVKCGICGKSDCQCPGFYLVPTEALLVLIKACEEKLRAGQVPVWAFSVFMKDEVRDQIRVNDGKTRICSSSPVDCLYMMRKYFGEFLEMFNSHPEELCHAIGLNPHSLQWTTLYHRLFPTSEWKSTESDVSDWDASLFEFLFEIFVRDVNDWYARTRMKCILNNVSVSSESEFEFEQKARVLIMTSVSCAVHVLGDVVFQVFFKNPSGNGATSVINCSINTPFQRTLAALWSMRNPDRPLITVKNIMNYFRDEVMGDDNLQTTNRKDFSIAEKVAIAAPLGFKLTAVSKVSAVAENLLDPFETSIVKRSFRFVDSVCYAPLDIDVILGQLSYRGRKMSNLGQLRSVADSFTMELYHHGKPVFDKYRTQLLVGARTFFPKEHIEIPTWDVCHKQFMAGDWMPDYVAQSDNSEVSLPVRNNNGKDFKKKPLLPKAESKPNVSKNHRMEEKVARLAGPLQGTTVIKPPKLNVLTQSQQARKEQVDAENAAIAKRQVLERKREVEAARAQKLKDLERNAPKIAAERAAKQREIDLEELSVEFVPLVRKPKQKVEVPYQPDIPDIEPAPSIPEQCVRRVPKVQKKPVSISQIRKPEAQSGQSTSKPLTTPMSLLSQPPVVLAPFTHPVHLSVPTPIESPTVPTPPSSTSTIADLARKYVDSRRKVPAPPTLSARITKAVPGRLRPNPPSIKHPVRPNLADPQSSLLCSFWHISLQDLERIRRDVVANAHTPFFTRTVSLFRDRDFHRAKTAFIQFARDGSLHYTEDYAVHSAVGFLSTRLTVDSATGSHVFYGFDIDQKNSSKLAYYAAVKYYTTKDYVPQMDVNEVTSIAEVQKTTQYQEESVLSSAQPKVDHALWSQLNPHLVDQTPKDFLERQYQLVPIQWLSTDAAEANIAEYRFPQDAVVGAVATNIKKFAYFSGDIEIEFRANANLMQSGMLMYKFLPNWSSECTQYATRLRNHSACQMIMYIPAENNVVKFRIPCVTFAAALATDSIDALFPRGIMGTIGISVVAPLRKADSTAAQAITITPFIRWVNPIGRGWIAQSEKSEAVAKSNNISASTILERAGTIFGAVSKVPFAPPYTSSVGALLTATGRVARAMGYSKTTSLATPITTQPGPISGTDNHGEAFGKVFGLSCDAAISNEPLATQDKIDYNQWSNYMLLPAHTKTVVWTSASVPYSTNFFLNVKPQETNGSEMSPAGLLSALSTYWTGGMKYRVFVNCSRFTTFRLRVWWTPTPSAIPDNDVCGDYATKIYNVNGPTCFDFSVPWNTGYFANYCNYDNANLPYTPPQDYLNNGYLFFQLITDIQIQGNNPESVYIVVFSSMAEDAVFYRPRHKSMTVEHEAYTPQGDTSSPATEELTAVFRKVFPPLYESQSVMYERLTQSDAIASWTEYFSAPIRIFTHTQAAGTVDTFNLLTYFFDGSGPFKPLVAAFQNHRGSIRVMIVPKEGCDKVRFFATPNIGNMLNSDYGTYDGWTFSDYITRQPLEFKVPWYSPYLFMNEGFNNWGNLSQFGFRIRPVRDDGAATNCKFDIFLSLGEDFVSSVPISLPDITINYP